MHLSVFCACMSVASGIVPYAGVYQIIIMFLRGNQTVKGIVFWSAICLLGYMVKLVFYAVSTMLSHITAYNILEKMRNSITERLMRTPLGTVLNHSVGKLKSIIVDRMETIELPLAHMIPEGILGLLLPEQS